MSDRERIIETRPNPFTGQAETIEIIREAAPTPLEQVEKWKRDRALEQSKLAGKYPRPKV